MNLKQLLSSWLVVAACLVAPFAAFAAVDVNTADQAALEGVKGLGPAMSARIIAERSKGSFRDWSDLATRVSGLGDKNTATLSRNGLVLDGKAKPDAPAMTTDAKPAKPDAKPATRPAKGKSEG
jgi:competence protein ComEA